jgi:hypothetical protein
MLLSRSLDIKNHFPASKLAKIPDNRFAFLNFLKETKSENV